MRLSEEKQRGPYRSPVKKTKKHVHLTKYELEGLIEVANWVDSLPSSKKAMPRDLIEGQNMLKEIRVWRRRGYCNQMWCTQYANCTITIHIGYKLKMICLYHLGQNCLHLTF